VERFEIADVGTWKEKAADVAREPDGPAGCAPKARPSDRFAPGDDTRVPFGRQRFPPCSAPSAAHVQRPDLPCTSIEEAYTHRQQLVWTKLLRLNIARAEAEEIHQEVFLAMDRMIHKNGLPDNMVDLGGPTQEDVAGILGRPLKTVKTQHLRARARFRELVERLYKADLGGGT
jgi:hypothetical protein